MLTAEVQKLNAMSIEEIVKLLEKEGVEGDRYDINESVLANYFSKKTGRPVAATAVAAIYRVQGEEPVYFEPTLRKFVIAFDQGKYPQLVRGDSIW